MQYGLKIILSTSKQVVAYFYFPPLNPLPFSNDHYIRVSNLFFAKLVQLFLSNPIRVSLAKTLKRFIFVINDWFALDLQAIFEWGKSIKHWPLNLNATCKAASSAYQISKIKTKLIDDNCGERAKCVATTKTAAIRAKAVIIATTTATSTDVNCLINKFSQ